MTNLQIFNNDRFGQVRIVPVDDELMFVVKDGPFFYICMSRV